MADKKTDIPTLIADSTKASLQDFNHDYGKQWTFGENWSNVNTMFETYVNKYLFPKINETLLIDIALGNRFNWLAKEQDFIGQYSEEYVIMDTIPIEMNLSKSEELMLKRNYPQMATRLYGSGIVKKQKFTLNNNDVRFNFQTLGDATNYALGVLRKKISDINVQEEKEIRAMMVDYAINQLQDSNRRTASSKEDLTERVFEAILNMQNNSAKYNEVHKASGGSVGQYTTVSKLSDIAILTTDSLKSYLLDTKIANTFQMAGIDFTDHIISFDDLGGVYKTTKDVTLANEDTINYLRAFGDYQAMIGDVIPTGSVFTFNVSDLKEFKGNIEEIKPQGELFAFIFDINALKYKRNTKGMLKEPFYNGEFDEVTHWIHYYSFKAMSPFFNKILITEAPKEQPEAGATE
ncbi:major head protein [Staphylococcus phage BESEP3]|jgi:major head protein|uniref:Major capsid protein n=1 Tax=Staphylococcus phage BESEP3 TaxID=3071005 RepID=A0AAE7FJU7_9CAUD|nr:major head protein [Staphylococcus phage BESEP3]QLF86732.1 major capsid protein [Staphylococcus phage BESEP3]UXR08340.1 capsid and scaffold [Staphylococcus phage vB_ScaM-V1SC05]